MNNNKITIDMAINMNRMIDSANELIDSIIKETDGSSIVSCFDVDNNIKPHQAFASIVPHLTSLMSIKLYRSYLADNSKMVLAMGNHLIEINDSIASIMRIYRDHLFQEDDPDEMYAIIANRIPKLKSRISEVRSRISTYSSVVTDVGNLLKIIEEKYASEIKKGEEIISDDVSNSDNDE